MCGGLVFLLCLPKARNIHTHAPDEAQLTRPRRTHIQPTTTPQFTSPEDAMSFMEYLNLAATCGDVLVECFKHFDRNNDR